MKESKHALEYWLRKQADEAVSGALETVNQPPDIEFTESLLQAMLAELLNGPYAIFGNRTIYLCAASYCLRLAAMAHRESVQGGGE